MRQYKTDSNKFSGFTLIELMLVISIIGLLASFMLASVNVARAKARDIQRLATIRDIVTAIESYYVDHNSYYCSGPQNSNDPDFLKVLVDQDTSHKLTSILLM